MNSCSRDNGWKETVCFVVSFISRWSISRTGHEADARYCPHWVSGIKNSSQLSGPFALSGRLISDSSSLGSRE